MRQAGLLLDSYTVTAGDVAAAHVGRGFNTLFGQWMTVSGTNLGDSRMTGSVLLAANIGIHTSGGMMRDGVVITAYVLNDPLHPEMAAEWFRGLHSKGFRPHWEGRRDMCAGFFWRIEKGGLVATDVVDMLVRYE